MGALAFGAWTAALAGSPHCVGMCGPLIAASQGGARGGGVWQAGKLLTYVALGAIAGGLGGAVPGPTWLVAVVGALGVLLAALQLGGLLPAWQPSFPGLGRLARAARVPGWAGRLASGAVAGLLPCGLVWAALPLAVASGSAVGGAVVLAAFGVGTVPALSLAALGAGRIAQVGPRLRRALALVVLVSGWWSISTRAGLWAEPTAEGAPSCHAAPGG
jgi:hypothetical protein